MPDKIKEAFEATKDNGIFLDEEDFRSSLSKEPKAVFELFKADKKYADLFLDYDDFENSLDLKKKDFQGFSQELPKPAMPSGKKFTQGIGLGVKPISSTVPPLASKQPKSTTPLESTGEKESKQGAYGIGKMLNVQSMPSEKPAFMEDLRQRAELDDKILNDPTFTLLSSQVGDKNETKRVKLFEEKNKAIASERGYKDVKELYSDMDEYLADFLGEREKEEYIGKRDRVELLKQINQAKAAGLPTEELQKIYDEQVAQFSKAKADLVINADQEIRNLRRELEGADPEDKADILSQIDGLEASKKDFFKPKTQDAKTIVEAEGLKEGATDQEKVQIYAHALMRERSDLRESLGITKDRDAMIAYYTTAGADNPYWKRLQDVEDKLESVAPVVLINETPITGTESAWSVFGKVFKENLIPAATDKGTEQEIAGNLIRGLELAGVDVKSIQEDAYKTLDKTSKPYEDWSSKDLALMAAPTLAIMPKFVIATLATEGLGSFAAVSPYWRGIKILSQRGSLGTAAAEGSLLKVIQANKYGRGLLQAGFKGLEYGTQSQVETMIFAADKGEMGFVNGLVGGSLGVGAEKLTTLAGKGIAKALTSIFGNKAPDATGKILAAAKKAYTYTKEQNTKALGEVGEELGEDLGGMWMESENGEEFFDKINEHYGTPSKALKFFLSTYMMGYGIGTAGELGSAAFSSAGKMYKNLSAKDRAIADNVISDLRQEQNSADVDAGIDLVNNSKLTDEEKAKAEEQITAQGEAVNGVIEGNLTTEELKDVVSSLDEKEQPQVETEKPILAESTPSEKTQARIAELESQRDSEIKNLKILFTDNPSEEVKAKRIEARKQEIADEYNSQIEDIKKKSAERAAKKSTPSENKDALKDVESTAKALEGLVNQIPTTELRRPNGSIGTQGFSSENLVSVARFIADEMGFNIPAFNENLGTSEIKQVIEYLKTNKEAQQKIKEYVIKDPVVVNLLPDGTYAIEDGNHRANLLNLIGVDAIPTIELNGRSKQDAINDHNKAVESLLSKEQAPEVKEQDVDAEKTDKKPAYIEQTEGGRNIITRDNVKNNFPIFYERVVKKFSNSAWDSSDIRDAISYLISNKPTYKNGMNQLISAQIEAEKLLSELGQEADFITRKELLEKIRKNENYSTEQKDVFEGIINRLKGDKFFDFTNKNIDSDNGYQFSNNLLKAKDADAFIHEVGHWGFYNLLSSEQRTKYLEYVRDRFYGTENKMSDDLAIKRKNEILDKILESNSEDNFSEYFAEQFRQYIIDGIAPKEVKSIFENFKEYLFEIVKLFKEKGYNKDLKPFFDTIIETNKQQEDAIKTKDEVSSGDTGARTDNTGAEVGDIASVTDKGESGKEAVSEAEVVKNPILKRLNKGFLKIGTTIFDNAKQLMDKAKELTEKGEQVQFSMTMPDGSVKTVKRVQAAVVDGFYSNTENALAQVKQEKMSGSQWATQLLSRGANKEEMGWVGLEGFLKENAAKSVSKADIQQFLKDNRISVVEVVGSQKEGNLPKSPMREKITLLQLKGEKENYKEILVTLPNVKEKLSNAKKEYDEYYNSLISKYGESGRLRYKISKSELDKLDELKSKVESSELLKKEGDGVSFESSHYDEPNILVHLRMNTRTDSKGNKVLFLEEVQSDWGQEGKKEGFENPENTQAIKELENEKQKVLDASKSYQLLNENTEGNLSVEVFNSIQQVATNMIDNPYSTAESRKKRFLDDIGIRLRYWSNTGRYAVPKMNQEELSNFYDVYIKELENNSEKISGYSGSYRLASVENKIDNINKKISDFSAKSGISTAPFVTDTSAWTKLGLKVALKEAVKQGVDKIAWTTGEQQIERYSLEKVADEIRYSKNEDGTYRVVAYKNGENVSEEKRLPESKLEATLGKDVAQRIIDGVGENIEGEKSLTGENLKVGGKGMKGFYGSPTEGSLGIVGNVAKSLTKQEPKTGEIDKTESKIRSNDTFINGKPLTENAWATYLLDVYQDSENYTITDRYITAIKNKHNKAVENAVYSGEEKAANDKIVESLKVGDKVKFEKQKITSTQHSIDITPELKEQVEEGLPLFHYGAKGEILGFTFNGKIYLNGEKITANTTMEEAGHIWVNWSKENRLDLYKAGLSKVKGSKYLSEVEANKSYQKEALKLGKKGSPAYNNYMKEEALAKAIADNGAKFVTETRKNDFIQWVNEMWKQVAKAFGIRDLSTKEIKALTLEEFSKMAAADVFAKEQQEFPENVLDIAKETGLSPQEVQNTYKKYDGTKSIEEITIDDYNNARAAGNEQKLENSKKAFEALLKADSDSPTAKKKADKLKEEVSKETLKGASDIMRNIDEIRKQLLDAGVIKSINCKWGK